LEDGCGEQALGLAAQYESTFGKPATVKDYTGLVENHKPLPGSARPHFSNTGKKNGQADSKKAWTSDPRKTRKAEPERKYMAEPKRKYMPNWFCGQIFNSKACGKHNFYYTTSTGTVVTDAYRNCRQPKKEQPKKALHAGSECRPSFANTPTLGAAAIEKMIEEKIAIGVQQALDAHMASDGSALAAFMQSESGDAFNLGLGGIADNSMDGDDTLFPAESEAVADKFGNNAEAYLVRGKSHSNALVSTLASMSWLWWLLAIFSGISGLASSIMSRVGQAVRDAISWMAPAAGGQNTITAGVCILFACCVLFTQLASTQALNPHAINAIGVRHAVENWGIEIPPGTATRFGLKRLAQGHEQYCLQAAAGFAKGQLFLDFGASTTLIHDASILTNVRPLPEPKMVMGLTGPQAIKFTGDLCLNMVNTTSKPSKIIVKNVYYDPFLQYNLVSVTDISRTGHVTTFLTISNLVSGPAGAFELVKTCEVYALPVNSKTELAAFGADNMTEEELMHLRLNHCVSYVKMQVLSKSGARGVNSPLKGTKRQCNICTHANITRNPAPPASTGQTGTICNMSYDLFDMSKIKTIGGNRYCSVFLTMDDIPRQSCMLPRMRFPRSLIVCCRRRQTATSPASSCQIALLNIARSSYVKSSESTG